MERPSKFDRAVQQRMSQLQDEPSARVWSGIRAEIGYTPRKTSPIWFRLMAGAALVAGLGAAWYFLAPQGPAAAPVYAKAVQHRMQDWKMQGAVESQEVVDLGGAPLIVDTTPDALPPRNFGRPVQDISPAPAQQPVQQPAPVPTKQEERFVEQELSPQQELIEQRTKPVTPVKVQEAEAIAGHKRSIRLPKAEDLSLQNIKAQSVGLLPNLAHGASERLGIDTQYERKAEQGATTTKFSVDLGIVKFKKVRKTNS